LSSQREAAGVPVIAPARIDVAGARPEGLTSGDANTDASGRDNQPSSIARNPSPPPPPFARMQDQNASSPQ
jgi:hypothetical protein